MRVSGGFYGGDYQSIAIRKITATDGAFWVVEQRKRATIGVTGPTIRIERRWVDGRSCPALGPMIDQITGQALLEPPLPRAKPPPGMVILDPPDAPAIPPFHGNTTFLGALKQGGEYQVRFDYEGPITRWWRTTEQKLESCWGYRSQLVDGEELPLTLETDADEAPYIALEQAR